MNNFDLHAIPRFFVNINAIFIIMLMVVFLLSFSAETCAEVKPKHHTKNGFRNYPVEPDFGPVGAAFYFRRVMDSFFLPDVPSDHLLSEEKAIGEFQKLNGKNSITWLGHATFLIRINGMTILTDPFLTEYASPFWTFGPRRFVQPGISLENLPPIDIVIVSHNHLDHLDEETIESLQEKHNIHVFVPLGLEPFFRDRDFTHVNELDWNMSHTYGGIEFTALPAVHNSGRGANDKNTTLWCSWSISAKNNKLFFSGDTSYLPTIFKTIGEKMGPYDMAIVGIGAYKTRKHGPASHLTPEEAVKVILDTKSNVAVAMHWGTIELSDEPTWEPPVRFKKAAQGKGIPLDKTWVMKVGETRQLPN